MMHNARLETSERLARVHAVLDDGEEHSTLDILQRAGVCAVNSCVAELRECGAEIRCRMIVSDDNKRTFLYRMMRPAPRPQPSTTDTEGGDSRHSTAAPGATMRQRELPLAGRAAGGGDLGNRAPTSRNRQERRL